MRARVLVADDSVTIRKFVTLAFESEAVEVLSAADGAEALQHLESWHPDVVLADVLMPGISGYELCERIRNSPELCSTGVILLVGMFEAFDQDEALRVGCDGHLSKPIDPTELLQTVRSVLERRRPEARAAADASQGSTLKVSERTWASFTARGCILDIIRPALGSDTAHGAGIESARAGQVFYREAGEVTRPSDDLLASRVEEAVRRIAPAIVRELVEEVLPGIVRRPPR